MRYLRNNTATIVTVGPFYDKADGVTIEGSLTITNEKISMTVDLNEGSAPTLVLDNVTGATSGTDNDLNYIANCDAGLMQLELSAANTNYLGRAFLTITDAANHVPVFHEFTILPANVFDALVLGSGTDLLDVSVVQLAGSAVDQSGGLINANVKQISGDATAADNLEAATDGGTYNVGGGAVVAASITAGVTLANDAITAAKFDESTAFPLASADTGATAVARTGADSDTLETLSDQLDGVPTDADVQAAATASLNAYDPPTNAEMVARTLAAASYFDPAADTVTNVTNVATLAGHTPQTGDSFARLGAPAGASVSADIADVPTVAEFNARTLVAANYFDPAADTVVNVTNVATLAGHTPQTGDSFARLGAPAGVSVSADIADVPTVAELNARTLVAASYFDPAADTVTNVTNVATLAGHTPQTGDSFARLGAPAGVSVSADIADVPTVAELNARTLVAANYFDPAADTVTVGTNNDKAGYALSAAGIDGVLDEVVEAPYTMRQLLTIMAAVLAGKASGGNTANITFRNLTDAGNRVQATVDVDGNRTAVTLTV